MKKTPVLAFSKRRRVISRLSPADTVAAAFDTLDSLRTRTRVVYGAGDDTPSEGFAEVAKARLTVAECA
jgi:hypothetical protein